MAQLSGKAVFDEMHRLTHMPPDEFRHLLMNADSYEHGGAGTICAISVTREANYLAANKGLAAEVATLQSENAAQADYIKRMEGALRQAETACKKIIEFEPMCYSRTQVEPVLLLIQEVMKK